MPVDDGTAASTVALEDIKAIIAGISPVIREYVEKQIAPLTSELEEQKKRNWQLLDGESFGAQIADAVKSYIVRELGERDRKIAALEKEIDDLHKSNNEALRYQGVFNRTQIYERGHVCTYGGLLWFCIKNTVGKQPGNSDDWQLMTKHNSVKAAEGSRTTPRLVGKL